jgi:hypothetical protein
MYRYAIQGMGGFETYFLNNPLTKRFPAKGMP